MSPENHVITHGCRVTLHYSLALEDGTEVVSTFDDAPLTFELGDGTMTEPLEQILVGLHPGAEEQVILSGDETFGARTEEKVHWIARDEFPSEIAIAEGQVMAFTTPAGDETAGQILEIDEDKIRVDFNHPLSGHTFMFHVKIIAVTT
jgi:FKBP-type peptidyl-prolyl cis-trans isomerase SlpA